MWLMVARDGETRGPYAREQVARWVADGTLHANDLAMDTGVLAKSQEWLPLAVVLELKSMTEPADPPNLRWWTALALDIVTLSAFFVVWDCVLAWWMRRALPRSWAFYLYAALAALSAVQLPASIAEVSHYVFNTAAPESPWATPLGLVIFVMRRVAQFSMRRDLCEYYNHVEPLGLELNGFLTLLFGGLYFQFAINKLMRLKAELHRVQSSPA